jgi:hypothetical protein
VFRDLDSSRFPVE